MLRRKGDQFFIDDAGWVFYYPGDCVTNVILKITLLELTIHGVSQILPQQERLNSRLQQSYSSEAATSNQR